MSIKKTIFCAPHTKNVCVVAKVNKNEHFITDNLNVTPRTQEWLEQRHALVNEYNSYIMHFLKLIQIVAAASSICTTV